MSNITKVFGLYLTICLHSSEPIDPPPPVTKIVLPFISSPIDSLFNTICSLPNTSSISTFLKFCISVLFFMMSVIPGSILIFAPVSWQILIFLFCFCYLYLL